MPFPQIFDIALVMGSPSEPSRSTAALRLLREYIADEVPGGVEIRFTEVSVRSLPAAALLQADTYHPEIANAVSRLQAADAVILATPVYQSAYSGALKALLDLLPQQALADKAAVLPVATGGSLLNLLEIDYALRPVLSALGARNILTGVYLTSSQFSYREEYGFLLEAGGETRMRRAVRELLSALRRDSHYAIAKQEEVPLLAAR